MYSVIHSMFVVHWLPSVFYNDNLNTSVKAKTDYIIMKKMFLLSSLRCDDDHYGERGSVVEWLACWTQAQKGLGSNRSCDTVG